MATRIIHTAPKRITVLGKRVVVKCLSHLGGEYYAKSGPVHILLFTAGAHGWWAKATLSADTLAGDYTLIGRGTRPKPQEAVDGAVAQLTVAFRAIGAHLDYDVEE